MKKSLLFLFAALLPLVASAQTTVEIDGIWYNLITKGKVAEVTSKSSGKYSGSITIPATVTYEGVDYSVTSIGSCAFEYCSSLTTITLPEGVTSIGSYAFQSCSKLTAITIPEGVTSIGDYAFYYCTSLTAITIPENSQLTSIGEWAFEYCTSLTAVYISSIEAWCKITFGKYRSNPLYYAHNLYLNGELVTNLVIPDGVTSIGASAFSGCTSLTSVTIPEGVTSISNWTFNYCSSLTSITIPEGVTSIGHYAFGGCSSLTAITIPEGVTSIGEGVFSSCTSLTAVTIPEGVKSIGGSAFAHCSSLTAITIPGGVTSIGNYAFWDCSSLTTIMLPKSVKSIDQKAFINCSELTDVYCNAEKVPSTKADAFEGSYIEYATLHVPTSAVNEYKNTAPWSSFGKVETLEITVDEITLSQSAAELIEGESLQLTATVSPDDAEDKSIFWSSNNPSVATVDNTGKVTAVAPGTATITATANDGSEVSASCEVTVKELILGKCAAPTISYEDGKVLLTCDTEGAIIKSITTEDCAGEREEGVFNITPTYTITAYATKENYEDSDIATATLCWIACNEEAEEPGEGIINIPSKAVLISTQGGTITVNGLTAGTEVAVYSTAGTQLATATATDDTATLSTDLTTGSIAMVKIGKHSIKVAIK